MLNPTVLTAGQEREARGGFVLGSSWNGKGTHMWRLKQEKPELFEKQDNQPVQQVEERPPGFERCHLEGWLYNKERSAYYELATRQCFWFDELAQLHRPLWEGEGRPVAFAGGAAAAPSCSLAAAAATKPQPAPKHILVSDLRAAAKALKMDFGHFDRPSGALAIVGAAPGSAPPDAAARLLPEKLLRRLAAFRGEWSDEMLAGAIAGAFVDVAAGLGGLLPAAAAAVVTGQRMVVAAAPGAQVVLAMLQANGTVELLAGTAAAPAPGEPTATRCRRLTDGASESLLVALAVGEVSVDSEASAATMAAHLALLRPRAASVALLKAARDGGAQGPLGVACARLGPRPAGAAEPGSSAAGSSSGAPAAKRQKVEEPGGKVRLRQVLLRHGGVARPTDPVRQRPVKRTLEQAEEQMLGVLEGLVSDGCSSFASVCKAISECQSSLKGGEFAGDLGWLDRRADAAAQKDKALRVQLPANVLKLGFELAVGEMGDLVTSEQGVHLIQRTA